MRIVSNKVLCLSDGSIGYVHKAAGVAAPIQQQPREKPVTIDAESMWLSAMKKTPASSRLALADQLGLKYSALMEMGVAWGEWSENKEGKTRHFSAWWWPMRDGHSRIVGLRARDWNGNKWAVTGSRGGIFIPDCEWERELVVCEGATDCAALRQMNLFAIGRPAAQGALVEIKTFVSRAHVERVIIIADNDNPKPGRIDAGLSSAETLARNLPVPCAVVMLPCKDVREGVRECGLNYETLMALTNTAVWRNP